MKRESGNSVDVDRDAYGVLGFDFVVVAAAAVVVTVAVFATLQPPWFWCPTPPSTLLYSAWVFNISDAVSPSQEP